MRNWSGQKAMELLYLICSIASSTLSSAFLSLRLAFDCIASCVRPSPGGNLDFIDGDEFPLLQLYQGRVHHVRRTPRHHAFEYPVRYALLNLDRACSSEASALPSSLFSRSFFDGHLTPDDARAAAETNGPVLLLTIPPSVGYEQNPLSIYYCYDKAGAEKDEDVQSTSRSGKPDLRKCIAEVTNTPWGEKVQFVFDPNSDLVAKPLHVSPFMDMLGSWKMFGGEPGEKLSVRISVQHPEMGNYFTATLSTTLVLPSSQVNPALFFWLMPHKVALWIYWQATKLWWKEVRFVQHPRYSNPGYREEAMERDRGLHCCGNMMEGGPSRWCVWKEAKWPWC